jgi:lipopolysaccharide/colanic/teichoic acid biosynthesis glycosyltransferase
MSCKKKIIRCLDVLFAAIGLIVTLPLMVVISIAIKTTSSGPVLYKQKRIGFKEKEFYIYKFRTMIDGADKIGSSVTVRKDSRITQVGSVLRRFKLDEIPQLINVLKGEMSFVGPRPDTPEIIAAYTKSMKQALQIKPGITGLASLHLKDEEEILAQVNEPDAFYLNVLVPLKVKLAEEHRKNDSVLFYLKMIIQTVWMLFFGKWLPIQEHPEVVKMRNNILLEND